ncbi:hypothetical protein ECC02_010559 [Trypanosoma cruzi]|uniref:Uncharacterized protein n=1 Tax=Trypanosoma cruzi TaxID=5693 RepID=A0A7J6XS50_TRYCR|nr:hypothetical protein ECC02_010559 [Trypanosoma cruzi]
MGWRSLQYLAIEPSNPSAAQTDGQQHRASTNRAHSKRHVIIIVSVVIQWCGADLHSEGHGEQQGRREMRQTHTERAHHMRRGQQPGMHRTPHTTHDTHTNPRQQAHTHSPAATPTHRWKREKQTGAAHKAPAHVHTAREVRRVCTPHGGCAHTQEGAAPTATQKQSNNKKKEIPAHHADCWSTGSAANIHHKNSSVAVCLRPHSAHSTSCRPGHHRSSSRTRNNNKKQKRGGGVGDRVAAVTVDMRSCVTCFVVCG